MKVRRFAASMLAASLVFTLAMPASPFGRATAASAEEIIDPTSWRNFVWELYDMGIVDLQGAIKMIDDGPG